MNKHRHCGHCGRQEQSESHSSPLVVKPWTDLLGRLLCTDCHWDLTEPENVPPFDLADDLRDEGLNLLNTRL